MWHGCVEMPNRHDGLETALNIRSRVSQTPPPPPFILPQSPPPIPLLTHKHIQMSNRFGGSSMHIAYSYGTRARIEKTNLSRIYIKAVL